MELYRTKNRYGVGAVVRWLHGFEKFLLDQFNTFYGINIEILEDKPAMHAFFGIPYMGWKHDEHTNCQTDKRTNGQTDKRTNGRMLIVSK